MVNIHQEAVLYVNINFFIHIYLPDCETVLFCSLRPNQDRIKMRLDFNYALGQPRIKTFSFY